MMHKFGDQGNVSVLFYLKAQLEPTNPVYYANLSDKTSLLRTDYALYLYEPESQEEETK